MNSLKTISSLLKRAEHFEHPIALKLCAIIKEKQTNLCVAADLTSSSEILELAQSLGPHICMLKTHVDIISDFTPAFTKQLRAIADHHRFLIFEDRKFADIGNTVKHQCSGGIYQISTWADIINAHLIPGPGIIEGLQAAAPDCALLLLAQMSPKGNLATKSYTETAIEWANQYKDFVIGFIAMEQLHPNFLHFTPGVQLNKNSDALGQSYRTPQSAIENGTDVIIVGRGIIKSDNPVATAIQYKEIAWQTLRNCLSL